MPVSLCDSSSLLLFVPPFPERLTTAITIKGNHENSVKFRLQPLRENKECRPPSCDSCIFGHSKDFVSELNIALCFGDVDPIIEDRRTASHWFRKRSDLVGAIFYK